ncbi:WcaF family extracellular polysaccharide biosynthesis acetyltransferase [Flavobacterium chungbukense]|uniref:Colanic acid biosynthesis acetyltransferase n=1 Tax=Flavobacterium chungbukense TaxID=877464 RepID=A0ABP7YIE0_9FLAO|nr:WcaF family extracellular polysaccharide biosynthesis acetyltransferase [Flavobacterium chungbukense]MCC4920186.1 WcaF family extracellular polysaccharide biosynthesis acetyltransferase [Flavobacterium chungbukense]
MPVSLKTFRTNNFDKGRGRLVQFIWIFVNALFLKNSWFVFMRFKIFLLRSFGAEIGQGTVIKNNVNIKFPWKLVLGNDVWLGEGVWIDNLDKVTIGNDVCISQGALLLTGNHDYRSSSFDYRNELITIENGVWIGAKSVVCPGVVCGEESILTVGSIATKNLKPFGIYQGNPAVLIRERY